jgi:hypothetical protein
MVYYVALLTLGLCIAIGYALATWGPLARRPMPVEQICSRIDYMNGLQRRIKAEEAPLGELRDELRDLVGLCGDALSGRSGSNE